MRILQALFFGLVMAASPTAASAQSDTVPMTPARYTQLKLNGQLPDRFQWDPAATALRSKPKLPVQKKGGGADVCECWIPPDGSWTLAMPPNDDQSSALIPLPFTFNLYGDLYTSCYINNNGNITFNSPLGGYDAQSYPILTTAFSDYTMVAPYWEDADSEGGAGSVWYKVTPTALYVDWISMGYFNDHEDLLNTFSLIITDGNDPVIGIGKNVRFCYQDMQWTSGDIYGFNGFGSPGTVGANRGNGVDFIQFGRFDHAGTDYDGPFGAPDGISWLDDQQFDFTTEVSTSNIPPIGSGDFLCDTVEVCVGETVTLAMQFLSPEADQVTTANAFAPDFSNFSIISNTPGQTANITGEFTPTAGETGFHTVTFEATDNGVPALTSTYVIVVEVQVGAVMEPGDTTVCDNAAPFDLYDLLGGSPLPGGDWTDPNGDAHSGTFQPGEDPVGAYAYLVGNGGSCPNTGIVTVATAASADAGTNGSLSLCTTASPIDLFDELNGTPDVGGAWTAPGGGAFDGTLDPALDAPGTYTYTVTATAPCANATATVQVVIQQAVEAGTDSILGLCTSDPGITLFDFLGGSPTVGGTWTAPDGSPFGGSFDPAADDGGLYTYTVDAIAPCPDANSALSITLDAPPFAGNDGSVELCPNADPEVLFTELLGGPDAGGAWVQPDGAPHSGTFEPGEDANGSYAYIVQGQGGCTGLSDSALVEVTVFPRPLVSFIVEPDSGCLPLEVRFINTTDPQFIGGACVWDLGDGSSDLQACDTLDHVYEEADHYNVVLEITSPQGCTERYVKEGAVLAEPAPTAAFSWTPDPATEEAPTVLFSADDPYASVFRWSIAGDSSAQRQVSHTFPSIFSSSNEVCLHVADRYGCVDSLCQVVEMVVPLVYVPNAFSPNGDGVNDIFFPRISGVVPEDHQLFVFDRWGQQVFYSTDPTEGWTGGKGNAEEPLPQGVYIWRLLERPVGSSDVRDTFGTVTLLK
ncbi:MAG: gliding motility-associated C-terminal domain-containing protein [Flavobacteriales bacterium]|nr:gliding motility-associated C-terminal domain-containing protein [Flavobacteriales bacterium]